MKIFSKKLLQKKLIQILLLNILERHYKAMCGINGIFNFRSKNNVKQSKISLMVKTLNHRGPDQNTVFIEKNLGLGFSRLSIIDIQNGMQPLESMSKRYIIICNGEIYNYKKLRQDLIKKGYKFKTNSDVEIILGLFELGVQTPENLLNGMFSFACYDRKQKKLILSRDRMGKKPLFYYLDKNGLYFSSEIKGILSLKIIKPHINYQSISEFISSGYIGSNDTAFKNIFSLKPGHRMIVNNKIKYNKWWSIPSFREKNKSLFNSFEDKIEKQLLKSVKKRLVSDAKMGIFLSGGLDSSLILAMTKKIGLPEDFKSYSLGFKEKTYDETENASFISAYFGVPNQKIIMGHLDFKKIFFDAIIKADNLHSNPAMFANYFLAKNASKDIKVVLSGIGGDELFFGYPTYRADILSEKLSWLPNITVNLLRSLMSNFKNSHEKLSTHYKLKKFLEGLKYDKYKRHYYWRSIFNEKEEQVLAKDLFRNTNSFLPYKSAFNEFLGDDFLEHVAFADLKVWLANMALYQGDVMTMANSLENRMPFMDYELIELMLSIPRRVKYNGFKNKPLLRNISYKYLPTEFLKIPKSGFHLPLAKWFAGPLKDFVEDILHGNRKITSSILNFKIIEKILEDHFTFKEDNSFKILSLMVFTIWYNNYFIQKNY